mmetsp:Transcript_17356/g.40742  ORF Transcript_17356/g.40742 Transcript_17356/m.40742 type:complete len:212 (+) Transcript_17356:664-1299(+)
MLLKSSRSLLGKSSSAADTCATSTCNSVIFAFPGALNKASRERASRLNPATATPPEASLSTGATPKLIMVPKRTVWQSTARNAKLFLASSSATCTEANPFLASPESSAIMLLKSMRRNRCPTAGRSMRARGSTCRSASRRLARFPRKPVSSFASSAVGTAPVRTSHASGLSVSASKSNCSKACRTLGVNGCFLSAIMMFWARPRERSSTSC